MKKKPVLAIIGCGKIAVSHVNAFKRLGLSFEHCASSLNSKKVKKFAKKFNIPNVWKNPHQLARSPKYWDAIVLCSTTKSIPKILELLIKHKKPILVEKPVSVGIKYLAKFKITSPKFVKVGFNRRFYSTILKAKKFVKKSKGQVFCNMKLPEIVKEKNSKNKKFNQIFENTIHGIDALRYIFGDLKIIHKEKIRLKNFDSSRFVILKSKRKHLCSIIINSNSPDNFSLEIENGSKRFLLRPFEKYKIYKGLTVVEPSMKYPVRSYVPKLIENGHVFNEGKNFDLKPGFFEQATDFYKIILGKNSSNSATLVDAFKGQKLLKKIM